MPVHTIMYQLIPSFTVNVPTIINLKKVGLGVMEYFIFSDFMDMTCSVTCFLSKLQVLNKQTDIKVCGSKLILKII